MRSVYRPAPKTHTSSGRRSHGQVPPRTIWIRDAIMTGGTNTIIQRTRHMPHPQDAVLQVPQASPANIDSFSGAFRFLSNFEESPITDHEGNIYPTVEHAFQAMKTTDPALRAKVRIQPTPGKAKYEGRSLPLRSDWEGIKDEVMRRLVRAKFTQHPHLAAKLLATGQASLIEGNTWNDTYWGVCKGVGENRLGQILMEIRAELALEPSPSTPPRPTAQISPM